MDLIKFVESEYSNSRAGLPDFKAGDTVNVYVKIFEGNKERIQLYQGVVIQRKTLELQVKLLQYVRFLMVWELKESSQFCHLVLTKSKF